MLRIPLSEQLKEQIAAAAIQHADEVESQQMETDLGSPMQGKTRIAGILASSAMLTRDSGSHFENTSFHSGAESKIGEMNDSIMK